MCRSAEDSVALSSIKMADYMIEISLFACNFVFQVNIFSPDLLKA